MFFAVETFRVDLADRLGAGWSRGKPAAGGDRLDAADSRVVARRVIDNLFDPLAGQPDAVQLVGRQLSQPGILFRNGSRFDAVEKRFTELSALLCIEFARIPALTRGRHSQPPVNPARRRPVTTQGHARISRHSKSDR